MEGPSSDLSSDGDVTKKNDMEQELQRHKSMLDHFERRVLDLQATVRERDQMIEKLEAANKALEEDLAAALRPSVSDSKNPGRFQFSDEKAPKHFFKDGCEPEQMRKIFVGGLGYDTNEQSLTKYFSQYGTVTECVLLRDPTGKSRGFAFLTFSMATMVDRVQRDRPHVVDGKTVDTKRATLKGEESTAACIRKIFVGGIKDSTTESTLRSYFSNFGVVEIVECPVDQKTKKKRGFAYVTFNDADPVDKVSLIRYHTIDGKRCEAKKAVSKDVLQNKGNATSPGNKRVMPSGPLPGSPSLEPLHMEPPVGPSGWDKRGSWGPPAGRSPYNSPPGPEPPSSGRQWSSPPRDYGWQPWDQPSPEAPPGTAYERRSWGIDGPFGGGAGNPSGGPVRGERFPPQRHGPYYQSGKMQGSGGHSVTYGNFSA